MWQLVTPRAPSPLQGLHAQHSALTTSRPVAAPPPRSSPAISALRGDSLTGPGSSLRANDWHHQQAIHSTPSRGWWAYCLVVDSKVTAGESLEKEGRCTSAVVNNGAPCLTYWLNTKGREQAQNIDSYKVYVPQGRSSLSTGPEICFLRLLCFCLSLEALWHHKYRKWHSASYQEKVSSRNVALLSIREVSWCHRGHGKGVVVLPLR